MGRYTHQGRCSLCQMERSMGCHPQELENRSSMGAHKVGRQWDAFLTPIEVRVKQLDQSLTDDWQQGGYFNVLKCLLIFVSGSNHFSPTSNMNVPSNSQHFAQVQASGYSPALQRKKNTGILSKSGRPIGWMTEPAAPSAVSAFKDRDYTALHEAASQHDRQQFNRPQSILVRPDSHKNNTDKVRSHDAETGGRMCLSFMSMCMCVFNQYIFKIE